MFCPAKLGGEERGTSDEPYSRRVHNARAPIVEHISKIKSARIRVRIPPPKIEELAHQAQGAGIFAEGETPIIFRFSIDFFGRTSYTISGGNAVKKRLGRRLWEIF